MNQGVSITPSQWPCHGANPIASTSSAGFTNESPSMRAAATRNAFVNRLDGSGSRLVIGQHQELVLGRRAVGARPVRGQIRERRAGRNLPDERIALHRVVHAPADLALVTRPRSPQVAREV